MDNNNGLGTVGGIGELDLTRKGFNSLKKEMQNDIVMSKNCGYNTTTPADIQPSRYSLRRKRRPGLLAIDDDDEDDEEKAMVVNKVDDENINLEDISELNDIADEMMEDEEEEGDDEVGEDKSKLYRYHKKKERVTWLER